MERVGKGQKSFGGALNGVNKAEGSGNLECFIVLQKFVEGLTLILANFLRDGGEVEVTFE
jgi:hypothetical protein